jgi:hypothetical protein
MYEHELRIRRGGELAYKIGKLTGTQNYTKKNTICILSQVQNDYKPLRKQCVHSAYRYTSWNDLITCSMSPIPILRSHLPNHEANYLSMMRIT